VYFSSKECRRVAAVVVLADFFSEAGVQRTSGQIGDGAEDVQGRGGGTWGWRLAL